VLGWSTTRVGARSRTPTARRVCRINEHASVRPYVSAGIGTAGGSAEREPYVETADQCWTGGVVCGLGLAEVSITTDGSEGVGTGGSSGNCSGTAKYTF
jgi:hypothetical protein